MIATRRRQVVVPRLNLRVLAALSMGLLGFGLWAGTSSAESDRVAGSQIHAGHDPEEMAELAVVEVTAQAEKQGVPDGNDSGPLNVSPASTLSDDGVIPAGGASRTLEGRAASPTVAVTLEGIVIPERLQSDATAPHGDVQGEVDPGETVGARSDPIEESVVGHMVASDSAVTGSAVEEPAGSVALEGAAMQSTSETPPPGSVLLVQPRRSGPLAVGIDMDGTGGGHRAGTEEAYLQAPTSRLGEDLGQRILPGGHSIGITTGSEPFTGDKPLSNGTLFTTIVGSSNGPVSGSDGHSAARSLAVSGLMAATALILRLPRGRLRRRTIQGAVAGAGPPPSVGLGPDRHPVASADGVPGGWKSQPRLPLTLLSLASIRRPHPVSRWREPFTGADRPSRDQPGVLQRRCEISLAAHQTFAGGEPLPRWQRLHCALSPPPSASPPPHRGGTTSGPENKTLSTGLPSTQEVHEDHTTTRGRFA